MAAQYTWQNTKRRSSYRMPERGHVGKFVLIALVVAILVHLGLYAIFGRLSWKVDFRDASEWESRQFAVEQVQIEAEPELIEPMRDPLPEPELSDVAFDEIDLMEAMDEAQEIDISPDVQAPENVVIKAPALEGLAELELEDEIVKAPELIKDLPEMGDSENELREIPDGQLLVDEGDRDPDFIDPDEWNKQQLAKGVAGGDPDGLLKNYSDIDDLRAMPIGSLGDGTKPARLGSDLLFNFDSAVLLEGAYLSLMKLGALIAYQEKTYFILEGHTDLFGSSAYNEKLGLQRAEAVREFLINDFDLDPERIFVRSAGSGSPIVKDAESDRDAQAINRRVEIHMRKEAPGASMEKNTARDIEEPRRRAEAVTEPKEVAESPRRAEPVQPEEEPRRAILVKPNRAIPVDPR